MGRKFRRKPKRAMRLSDIADKVQNSVNGGAEPKVAVENVIKEIGASTPAECGGYLSMLRPALAERGITI